MKLFTKDKRIKEAVHYANLYFASEEFRKDILSAKEFDHANVSPKEILELFDAFSKIRSVEVQCTYFGFLWRNVLGKTVGNGIAYINSSGLNRQIWDIAATCVHEPAHVVDEYFPNASFGHGSNSPGGKQFSFPYWIGARAARWIKREVLKNEVIKITEEIEKSYFKPQSNFALTREVYV